MLNKDKLIQKTKYLFGRNFLEELKQDSVISEEEDQVYSDCAESLIEEFGWDEVYQAWSNYLYEYCMTPEEVVNFASLFWNYDGQEYYISNPYEFLGYFYFRLQMKPSLFDASDIMDSLSIDILLHSGYIYVDRINNPEYLPEKDERIIEEVNNWKNRIL